MGLFCVGPWWNTATSRGGIQPQSMVASPPVLLYRNGEQLWRSTNFSATSVRGKQGRGEGELGEIWAL